MGVGAERVAVETVGPLGRLLLHDVEEGPVVGGPRHRGHPLHPGHRSGLGLHPLGDEALHLRRRHPGVEEIDVEELKAMVKDEVEELEALIKEDDRSRGGQP